MLLSRRQSPVRRAVAVVLQAALVLVVTACPVLAESAQQRLARPSDNGRRPVDEKSGEFYREPTARDDLEQRLPSEYMPPASDIEGSPTELAGGTLFASGSLIDCAQCGAGGAGESRVRDLTASQQTLGFGHQAAAGGRIADDFTITDPAGWTIREVRFFAYQTGSTARSPMTSVDLRIWSGRPGAAGRAVVFDGGSVNRLTDSRWTGVYRVAESSSGSTNRPIMVNTVAVNKHLGPGTYWLDWQTSGRLPSGPWAPSLAGAGDALQSLDDGASWQPAVDPGLGSAVGFPFVIAGDSGLVDIGPVIGLHMTVGASDCGPYPTVFVSPGTQVEYCYTAGNIGDTAFSLHDLVDQPFGVIEDDLAQQLDPGFAHRVYATETINTTTTSRATWTAFNPGPTDVASAEATAAVFATTALPLWCNGQTLDFEAGIPSDWTVTGNNEVVWTTVAGCGEAANYTGIEGTGAACASSDYQGFGGSGGVGSGLYDTELRTSPFSLAGATSATLYYLANYQNLANEDFLDVDISLDNGSTWTTLLSWNEDHGGFRSWPGEFVAVDLSAYAGHPNLLLRWRYHDPVGPAGNDDWYAQLDEIRLQCELPNGGFNECRRPEIDIPPYPQAGVSDVFTLEGALREIIDLDVRVRIDHDWVGDLTATLEHVDTGTTVTLFDRPGYPPGFGCEGDDIHAVIDDEGAGGNVETNCFVTEPSIVGALVGGAPPDPTLMAAFDGEELAGDWKITLTDSATLVSGRLEGWCLLGLACGRQLTNIFYSSSGAQVIRDCGPITVGPNVAVGESYGLSLVSATAAVFTDDVSVLGQLVVLIDPSLAPP